jgi:hypothetical protein
MILMIIMLLFMKRIVRIDIAIMAIFIKVELG